MKKNHYVFRSYGSAVGERQRDAYGGRRGSGCTCSCPSSEEESRQNWDHQSFLITPIPFYTTIPLYLIILSGFLVSWWCVLGATFDMLSIAFVFTVSSLWMIFHLFWKSVVGWTLLRDEVADLWTFHIAMVVKLYIKMLLWQLWIIYNTALA